MKYKQTSWTPQPVRTPVTVSFYNDALWADAERTCKRIGHKWVDRSSGGPESGDISMYCDRCGFEHNVILY